MKYTEFNRGIPAGNPIANALVVIAGALAIGASIVLGFFAFVVLGSIVLVSQVFLRGMFYSSMTSRRRYSSNSSGGGQGQLIMMVVAIVCAILAPIFANILYFALSRKREYLADAGAVRLTRYPGGLAGALEKISGSDIKLESANKVTAPMYIANPLRGMKAASLFSTHPPIDERIKILKTIFMVFLHFILGVAFLSKKVYSGK